MVFQMEGTGEDSLPMSQEAYSAHLPGAEAKFEEGTPLKQSTDVTCPPLVLSVSPSFWLGEGLSLLVSVWTALQSGEDGAGRGHDACLWPTAPCACLKTHYSFCFNSINEI